MSILAARTTGNMSFGTADDLTGLSLALMQAGNEIRTAVHHADRLIEAGELAEGEGLDLQAVRQTLEALPRLLEGLSRPLAHLFAQAEAVDELGQATVSPDDDEIPF